MVASRAPRPGDSGFALSSIVTINAWWTMGFLILLFLDGLMIPMRLAIALIFVIMRQLHPLDALWSLILVYMAGGMSFTICLMVNLFQHVPRDLKDAAILDAAGPLQVYWQVMLPLA